MLVSEMACSVPGCPPLETVVAFWTEDERRHQFKLYKPLREVLYDDVGWLMGSPAAHGELRLGLLLGVASVSPGDGPTVTR